MRWSRTSSFVSLSLAVVLAACGGDTATAPSAAIAAAPEPPAFMVRVDRMAPDSSSADFTVNGSGGTFQLGPHAIYFPSKAICDPATSGYGVELWDTPCTALSRPIQIHAEIRKVDGREWVDFSPELRFVPSRLPSRWVWIWMRTDRVMTASEVKDLNILWAPSVGAPGIDESLADPTLQTHAIPGYAVVFRRIKHFSGYMVSMGFIDTTTQTLDGGL